MVVLALETATRAGSLAVSDAEGRIAAMTGDPSRTHGVRLPAEIFAFLSGAGLTLAQVDVFAAVTGPGSFTGLRVGLATIQGLALTRQRRVVGIPTLEALASGWVDEHPAREATLAVCLDGARGDVFFALYDVGGGEAGRAREVIGPRVASPDAAAADVRAAHAGGPLVVVGDGAGRYGEAWRAQVPGVTIDASMPNLAAAALRLAVRRPLEAADPHALRPVYVRRPDAVLARERARAAEGTEAALPDPHREAADSIEVRLARSAEDLAGAAGLQQRVFGHAWEPEALGGGGRGPGMTARLHAARTVAGAIVGYCTTWQILDEAHVNSVAVDPAFRRMGIGRRLVQAALDEASAAGATSATLEVRASNQAGRALYEGLGFVVEGVRRAYYEHPVEDALILWRRGLGPLRS